MHLVYFPIAGRGELIRLIAKVGGVKDFSESTEMPEGITKEECGSPGSLPILIDGDLKMNESVAIESYVASVAPKFSALTPKQRAKDAQFSCLKESCLGQFAKPLFNGKDKEGIHAVAGKYFPVIESILPDSGFINGLDYPTVADLAVVVICEQYMPFGACYKHGEVDLAKSYPKLVAHSERVKAVDDVSKALSDSSTLGVAAFGV
eukprot:scaffold78063_cov72-Cyclotella_meneghiniana.AAC.3